MGGLSFGNTSVAFVGSDERGSIGWEGDDWGNYFEFNVCWLFLFNILFLVNNTYITKLFDLWTVSLSYANILKQLIQSMPTTWLQYVSIV